jgi:uncharacterized glyoxalase superfamily protein PhnB
MMQQVIPFLRYRDAVAAIDWLERAFGLSRHFVVPDADGGIVHAQLRFGRGMVMLGSAGPNGFGWIQPAEAGGTTGGLYLVVDDVEAHHARAVAAGAAIIYPPRDTDYGSREYAARDPDGHFWSFGSYDPFAAKG